MRSPRTSPSSRPSRATLVRWDRAHVWHPFTAAREYESHDPLVIAAGRGPYLYDVDGRRYLDGVSSLWCNLLGHRRGEIDRAVNRQLARIAHSTFLGITHPPGILVARRLVKVAPRGLTRVFFSDNGSTAVEVALKMAYQYWQQVDGGRRRRRRGFAAFANAYHGDTLGAVSLGGIDLFHRVYRPLLTHVERIPAPYPYRCPRRHDLAACSEESLSALARLLRRRGGSLAAVVLEPRVQGAAGMLVQPPGFVREVRRLCDRHGVLLILDEVATGFGRTGSLFACAGEGVTPDFLCVAKGLTGGYLPLAATMTTDRVERAFRGRFEEHRHFFHGHTYTANPLACAAALATLDVLARPATLARARALGARLGRRLAARLGPLAAVGDLRHVGLMAGVELVADRRTRRPFAERDRVGYRVCLATRRRGVFLRPLGDVLVFMPSLAFSPAQIDELVDAAAESVGEVTGR